MNTLLASLHKKRLVWSAKQAPLMQPPSLATGFTELDDALSGGWPESGVVSINSLSGIGELRLLLPALALRNTQNKRLMIIITPPYPVNAEFLHEQGIDLTDVLIVNVNAHQSQLWCAEQCLKSGCCACVLMWPEKLQHHQVKRFQLAAQQGCSVLFTFHAQQHATAGLPVSLALSLEPASEGIKVNITKRIGSWPVPPFTLSYQSRWPKLTQSANATPDYHGFKEQLG
ncbi:translesion DNA synthesis-associated protein ImuA [Alteromonas sediminis]|uniref:Translesion DNA synthesis-associated protein ImuA n=1 Tax=Alteromonas sediminis TaxID=2259342 RepID=A0A3N5Y3X2_9ALTE|nr:translesion DNA synthesis-associated protein ImuA [Alteromonas sediminis]RPJ68702.1 translesion DNA synthesis-associated protein ImuA [Alteromonas sediminis]